MSEKIEERYEDIDWEVVENGDYGVAIVSLIKDLMAEREKMKEDIVLLKRLLVQETQEHPCTARVTKGGGAY